MILFTVSVLQERGMAIRESLLKMHVIPRTIILYLFMLFVLATFMTSNSASTGFMYANF